MEDAERALRSRFDHEHDSQSGRSRVYRDACIAEQVHGSRGTGARRGRKGETRIARAAPRTPACTFR